MKLYCLAILLFCYTSNYAQIKSASLQGKITDAKTGLPLLGASIFLVDVKKGTASDSNGNYKINNIPMEHSLIEISFIGYRTIVEHIDIKENTVLHFQLSPSVIENEGVTVTAVGAATSIRKTPIAITRISKEQLLSTSSTNIIDALRNQPGVSQLSTGPAISKPIIRGLGYNRLVVINDGIRQEGQQWGDEHGIEIDENSVNRIEIVKGPASLIYGSDALAGVINIITATQPKSGYTGGNIISGYGTNNRQRSIYGNIGGNANRLNWNLWGDYKAAGDYKNKLDGYVWNSKFHEMNFGTDAGYAWKNGFSNIIISRFDQSTGLIEGERDSAGNFITTLPGGIIANPSSADNKSTRPSTPYQHIVHSRIVADNSFRLGKGKLTFTLGFQRNERKEFGNPDEPDNAQLYFDLQTFNYTAAFHFAEKKGWHTSLGINGMKQQNYNRGEEVLIPQYRLFDIGTYVYSQKTIGKSTFSGGLRLDNRKLEATEYMDGLVQKFKAFTNNYSNISGSAGISYAASTKTVIKLNVAKGFRAPSIPELASNGAHEGTNRYEYGNNTLQSEKTWQADFGFEYNSEHVLFKANAFYNHINNFIFYTKLAGVNNQDSLVESDGALIPAFKFSQQTAHLAGFEIVSDLHPHPLDWLHWQNTFSLVKGTFQEPFENNYNVPFIPATHLISELRAELFSKNNILTDCTLHFEIDHTFAQNHPFTAYETETATPAYTLINGGITTSIHRKNKKLFSLYLLGNNLTDVAYQSHLSRLKYTDSNSSNGTRGVFNTGRNFMIRIKIPFQFR